MAKTMDHTQAEAKVAWLKFHCGGRPSARNVSDSSEINYCPTVPPGSRRRTICERAREQRFKLGIFSTGRTKRSKSECSVVLGSCADLIQANMEFARSKIMGPGI